LRLVASYNRPGGNLTGINILTDTLEAKRLGLLRELVPQAGTVGFLWNPRFASAESQLRDVQEARIVNMTIRPLPASNDREIELAFDIVAQEQIHALAVAADPFLTMSGDKIVVLAAHAAVPAMYEFRGQVAAGGLTSSICLSVNGRTS
jgi:putative ABC transport system substrate-binding protein